MKLNKWIALIAAGCMAFSLTACGSKEAAPAETAPESEAVEEVAEEETEEAEEADAEEAPAEGASYHLGFALDTYNMNICAQIETIFEEECTARGYKFTVTDAEGDASKQLNDVSSLVNAGVDAIIILPVSSQACDEAVETAYNAGIPIATVLRDIPNEADKYVCFSGTNDIELGEIGGQWIADVTGGEGKIAYISGIPGVSTAEDRTVGFHNIVDKYPGLEVVAEQAGNYARSDAMTAMEAILQANPEIDAIWCANDQMAGGACQAIAAAGREGILVCGANFQIDGYERLKSGEQAADITTPCQMVIPAIDSLITVLEGGEIPEKTLYYDLDLITIDNCEDFVDQLY
ncbi:MAG: sugar ABC transporter substrate-binding protein [Lachnospiraceae bacterium]|nr:sugar ABC transporter substrate-binding protein [Candidatus Equihabitans merdae]